MMNAQLEKIKHRLLSLKKFSIKDTSNTIKICDFLLFCHDVNRGVTLNGKAYSPLMDSLRDEFESQGFTCTSIAHPWSTMIGSEAYGQPVAMNRSHLLSIMLKLLLGKFGFKPDVKLYERLIKRAQPKAIVTIGCQEGLCEAARNMNVFHAELLHGIGYTAVPWGWDKKQKQHLPQGILSLDVVSTGTLSDLGKQGVLIKEIPHPFLSRFHKEHLDELPPEWLSTKKEYPYKKEILMSLQWGYSSEIDARDFLKGILPNGLFHEEMNEVIKQTRDTVFWHFRFHPVQYRQPKKYKKLFEFIEAFVQDNKNCGWKESTYMPLPSLLSQCDGNITMYSMASYEAAYLGVPTLALCPSIRPGGAHENFFDDLVSKGYVTKQLAKSDDILEWVNNVKKREPLLGNLSTSQDKINLVNWLCPPVTSALN